MLKNLIKTIIVYVPEKFVKDYFSIKICLKKSISWFCHPIKIINDVINIFGTAYE